MSVDKVIIREARSDEHSALLTFLLQQFAPRVEPTVRYFSEYEHKIDETEKKIIAEDKKNRYADMLSKNLCYIAEHNESNMIVGLSLMSIKQNPKFHKTTADHKDSTDSTGSTPLRSKLYADFINYVLIPLCETVDFFVKFPNLQAALDLELLCVDSNFSGYGLATRLIDEAVRYAESKDIRLVYGLFTSPFSRKAAEKNRFETFSNVDILSLRDGDGNVIFKNTGSYVVSIMVKYLQPAFSNDQHIKESSPD